jgi:hypothetical protein
MIKIKTTYQSPNWDKRLNEYCKENRKAKAIRNSLTKKQREQVKKDMKKALSFVTATLKNMENNRKEKND